MNKPFALTLLAIGFAGTTACAHAAEPLALQTVMKDLGRHMQTVTGAIARENWAAVEETAHLIGGHPQPPLSEKLRIISFMGANMAKFKAFDEQTHEASHEMAAAAQAKDGQKVISAFQKLQTSCLNCHQAFRPAFVEHFYGRSAQNQ
jgi:cytochrome c556